MKRRAHLALALPLALVFALVFAFPVAAETLDEVIAKHIEARGGKAAWARVESLRLTGQFQAFSKINPFTLHKKRDYRYHMDHMLGDRLAVIGYDGEDAWWDNAWAGEGAQPVGGADRAVLERELDFPNPLFDYQERGFSAELVGETEVDGEKVIQIDLERGDGSKESWYLDPETYLEVYRDSPASDFGRPMVQRTFFDDFRDVGGVEIPHYTETQWYTRYRVMEVAKAELNVEVDDALFTRPPPPGMGNFQDLGGTWNLKVEQRNNPQAPWRESERVSEIRVLLEGALIEERYATDSGTEVIRTLSYDRDRDVWRMTSIDARSGLLNVMQGAADDDGVITLSNVDTGTPRKQFGMTIHSRIRMLGDATSPKLEIDSSVDGGENWMTTAKFTYTRPGTEPEAETVEAAEAEE